MEKMDTENLNKEHRKDGIISILITIVGLLGLIMTLLLFKENKTIEATPTNSNDRFEIIYEQSLPTDQCITKILVDRETDVEYLMVFDKVSHSMSITLMRDKGGMVLLRE